MPIKEISAKTGQLKKVQGLYRSANRRKYGQIIVEGPQAVRELLAMQPALVRDVYATESALGIHPDLAQLIARADLYLHLLPADLFLELSQDAQGILAVASMPEVPALSQLLQESKLLVFALRSADPGNLGTIIRAADAFGAQGVVIGAGSVEVTNPKVIRASVGSLFHLPVVAAPDATDFVALARSSGFQVCAAHGRADYYLDELAMRASNGSGTCDLRAEQIDLRKPTIWMLGNEAHGFSEQELALADSAVAIRMSGRAESLNVAMAASICLYTSAQAQLLASHLE